jgi:hypothetical protein
MEFMIWSSPAPIDANMRILSLRDSKNSTFGPVNDHPGGA